MIDHKINDRSFYYLIESMFYEVINRYLFMWIIY